MCGTSIQFRHQRLTILALIQTDITFAQMEVSRKNIVTFDSFEHQQTNKPQITLMSLLGEFSSLFAP